MTTEKGGKPLKFKTVEELQAEIEQFFKEVAEKAYQDVNGVWHHEPLTITGLALAIGTTRQGLLDYAERGEYHDTVKWAKTVVENYAEKRLFAGNATGAIFALKNFGWKDKSEVDNNQRFVDKDGEDLAAKDLAIIENFKNKIKGE